MAYYIPPWLMGQQYAALNGSDANGQPFQAPAQALSGQFGYSPVASGQDAGSFYSGTGSASPISQGAPQSGWAALLSNPQFTAGLASLAGAGQQQQVQPPMIRAPDPQTFDGRQYMPYLLSRAARGRVS